MPIVTLVVNIIRADMGRCMLLVSMVTVHNSFTKLDTVGMVLGCSYHTLSIEDSSISKVVGIGTDKKVKPMVVDAGFEIAKQRAMI